MSLVTGCKGAVAGGTSGGYGSPCRRLLLWALLVVSLSACGELPTREDQPPSRTLAGAEATALGRTLAPALARHPGLSAFYPLGNGVDAFVARLAFSDAAELSIDVQYYLFHRDTTGLMLTERLLRAADRGVRVRVLLDDMDMGGRDATLAALDSHPNVEIRLFNPFPSRTLRAVDFLVHFGTVTRRMHNKSFTVDDQVTIVGGRNIGDAYFAAGEGTHFGDMDLLAAGPVVNEVSGAFDVYWNSALAFPVASFANTADVPALDEVREALRTKLAVPESAAYAERLHASDLARALLARDLPLDWGKAEVAYDLPEKVLTDPEDRSTHMGPTLAAMLGDVRRELLVVSPYFVPGKAAVADFRALVERGVSVKVLTNSLASTDVAAVHAGYARYREALLEAGVELYELRSEAAPAARRASHREHDGWRPGSSGASLHAKTIAIDRERLFVGSANFDPRSAVLNTEMGIVVDNPRLAGLLAAWFVQDMPRIADRVELAPLDGATWARPGVEHRLVWTNPSGRPTHPPHHQEPGAGWWRRLQVWLLSFLPIERQL